MVFQAQIWDIRHQRTLDTEGQSKGETEGLQLHIRASPRFFLCSKVSR
jgi:hypothetical protein